MHGIDASTVWELHDLTTAERDTLRRELMREDLSIYSAIRMARKEVEAGYFDAAVACLRIDADKIRMHSKELYALLCR